MCVCVLRNYQLLVLTDIEFSESLFHNLLFKTSNSICESLMHNSHLKNVGTHFHHEMFDVNL